jgi:hypothetical protein
MLSITNKPLYTECRYAECHYAECRYAECRGTIECDLCLAFQQECRRQTGKSCGHQRRKGLLRPRR